VYHPIPQNLTIPHCQVAMNIYVQSFQNMQPVAKLPELIKKGTLTKLELACLKYCFYPNSLIGEQDLLPRDLVWSQYSVCMNTLDELRAFNRKKKKIGTQYAFLQLDYNWSLLFKNGLFDYNNVWCNPPRGLCLATDTKKFLPAPNVYNCYNINYWIHSTNKFHKNTFWEKKKKNLANQPTAATSNPFALPNVNTLYNVPFLICEVLKDPEFEKIMMDGLKLRQKKMPSPCT